MIEYVFKNAIEVLKKKPFMLWGVSLLYSVIAILVAIAGVNVPIISIPIICTLEAGMMALYLDGYNCKEVNARQLFKGFGRDCIGRVTGGMLWWSLWNMLWSFVPIVGVIKKYSYAFTPYILLEEENTSSLDALKESMRRANGYKLKMFCADILMGIIALVLVLVFAFVAIIPVIGTLVGFVGIVGTIILYPLFTGLVKAGFYQESKSGIFLHPIYKTANIQHENVSGQPSGNAAENVSEPTATIIEADAAAVEEKNDDTAAPMNDTLA